MAILERYLGADRLRLVDVGARDGIDPRWDPFAAVIEVTAFEPDQAECERLVGTAPALPYPARSCPTPSGARSPTPCPSTSPTGRSPRASIRRTRSSCAPFPSPAALLATRRCRSISTTTLDRAATSTRVGCDVLKLDVEGAELDVLRGGRLGRCAESLALEVEVELNPIFSDQPLFADVDAHLRERGWALQGLRRTSWRRGPALQEGESGAGGQIVSADALYFSGQVADELDALRELKLLVTASAYRQHDLVLARDYGAREPWPSSWRRTSSPSSSASLRRRAPAHSAATRPSGRTPSSSSVPRVLRAPLRAPA